MTVGSSLSDDFLPPDAKRIRIGEWIADQPTLRLERPGTILPTEPKVMDLLFLLAAARPGVVSKETIFATLWSGVHVGEESLARCVSKLRNQLGDDARNPRYIETISKRGYRLIAEVGPVAAPATVPLQPSRKLSWWIAGAALFAFVAWLAVLSLPRSMPPTSDDEQRLRELSENDREQAVRRQGQVTGGVNQANAEARTAAAADPPNSSQ